MRSKNVVTLTNKRSGKCLNQRALEKNKKTEDLSSQSKKCNKKRGNNAPGIAGKICHDC